MAFLASLLSCMALAGSCGVGPQRKEEPAPSGPAAQPPRTPAIAVEAFRAEGSAGRPVIVAFGDSLTAGHGVPPGESYPDHLQRLLDAQGYFYQVVNAGLSGDTTSGGVERLGSVLDCRPEIVILELGANDGLRGLPVQTTRANLDEMLSRLQAAGARVLLAGMTLPPNYGPDYIRSFEEVFRSMARRYRTPMIPFFLEGVAGNPQLMQGDGLHPNSEGCRRVAELVMKHLKPMLRRPSR